MLKGEKKRHILILKSGTYNMGNDNSMYIRGNTPHDLKGIPMT